MSHVWLKSRALCISVTESLKGSFDFHGLLLFPVCAFIYMGEDLPDEWWSTRIEINKEFKMLHKISCVCAALWNTFHGPVLNNLPSVQ